MLGCLSLGDVVVSRRSAGACLSLGHVLFLGEVSGYQFWIYSRDELTCRWGLHSGGLH